MHTFLNAYIWITLQNASFMTIILAICMGCISNEYPGDLGCRRQRTNLGYLSRFIKLRNEKVLNTRIF